MVADAVPCQKPIGKDPPTRPGRLAVVLACSATCSCGLHTNTFILTWLLSFVSTTSEGVQTQVLTVVQLRSHVFQALLSSLINAKQRHASALANKQLLLSLVSPAYAAVPSIEKL